MGVSETSDHTQIKIKMPNPYQEPPASSKAPNDDLNDMNVLCTLKIKITVQDIGVCKTSDHTQIKIKTPNFSQEPPASSKSPIQDLKDMDDLCSFKIKIES